MNRKAESGLITLCIIGGVVVLLGFAGWWGWSCVSAVHRVPIALERIADALDRAFPIPAPQEPTPR